MSERVFPGVWRREARAHSRRLINEATTQLQQGYQIWGATNSSLSRGENAMSVWLRNVLPERVSLTRYIEQVISDEPHRIALELGGPGSNLFGDFPQGFFEATAGVTLVDPRRFPLPPLNADQARSYAIQETYKDLVKFHERRSQESLAEDEKRNHTVIQGDFLTEATKGDVTTWQEGRQISVLFQKMIDGIRFLPLDAFGMGKEADYWYRKVSKLIFVQVPWAFVPHLELWKNFIDEHFANVLDVEIGMHNRHTMMRIRKLEGAPEALPLLDLNTVMQREQEKYSRGLGILTNLYGEY